MATRISPADRHTTIGQHAGMERSIAISAPTVGSARLYSSIVSTAPGDRTRVHHHGDCETSIYILSGAASYTYGPTGVEHAFEAAAGDFVYIPAGEIHVEANASDARAARRRADPQLPGFARRLPGRRAGRLGRRPGPVLRHWDGRTLPDLLAEHGLADAPEAAFANDGWSGASLTRLVRPSDGAAFVLKRTSWAVDWIARSTRDHALREGFIAATPLPLPEPLVAPYLGAAADGTAVAMLMPDLSDRAARLGAGRGAGGRGAASSGSSRRSRASTPAPGRSRPRPDPGYVWPTVPARRAAAAPRAPVRRATGGRRRRRRRAVPRGLGRPSTGGRRRPRVELVRSARRRPGAAAGRARRAARDGAPRRPQAQQRRAARGRPDRAHRLADDDARPGRGRARLAARRQLRGPADRPEAVLDAYRRAIAALDGEVIRVGAPFDDRCAYPPDALAAVFGEDEPARSRSADAVLGDWAAQVDLAWIVGLLLRGWRKGTDAEAGAVIGSGVAATDDLGWWCDRAVEAAGRRL